MIVASYNVHRCIGTDGRHDPARVARVLRELDADVIGLQEVAARVDGVDQLVHLARAAGFEAVAAPTWRDARGHWGNGLLTRRPILAVERIDLSVPGREPRGALDVRLGVGTEVVRVVVTHLGLRWRDRRAQVVRLLDVLDGDDGFVVLLGDINEWLPRGGCLAAVHAHFGATAGVRSFPARRPVFRLDRIWARPYGAMGPIVAHRTPLARVASDHLPVRTTIAWPIAQAVVALHASADAGRSRLRAPHDDVERGASHRGAPCVGEATADTAVACEALAALQVDDHVEPVARAEPAEPGAREVVHRGERLPFGVRRTDGGEYVIRDPPREVVHADDAEVRVAEREAVDRGDVRVPARHEHAPQLGEERGRAPHVLQDLRAVDEVHGRARDG